MSDTSTSSAHQVPEKPTIDGLEATWTQRWDEEGIYAFNRGASRDTVYSIDTPPPTVSGSLHVGHVFSYTHTDVVGRYWRMRGKDVFYRWAGTTTASRPSGASRTTSACAVTRPSPTTITTWRRRSPWTRRWRSRGATSSSSATASRRSTKRPSRTSFEPWVSAPTGACTTRRS